MTSRGALARGITANDVAARAGVSQAAVSRAFTPGASVSQTMRKKVMKAAGELGYQPNAIARSLITRRSRIVGVAMAYLDNLFYPHALEALAARLNERGLQILLFTAQKDRAADPGLQEILRYQVDALILASTTLSSALAEECRRARVPVVLFNRKTRNGKVASVTGDNVTGGRQIGRFFAACGHRTCAYIAGLENASTSRDRERGFSAGLRAAGAAAPLRAVGHYSFDGARAAARTLLSLPTRPDAIFAANDHMAFAAMDVARREFGLRIPEDVAFAGFDDVPAAEWGAYDLTSFSQPLNAMVDEAVALLDAFFADGDAAPRQVVVPGELILRSSTRPPPSGATQRGTQTIWQP